MSMITFIWDHRCCSEKEDSRAIKIRDPAFHWGEEGDGHASFLQLPGSPGPDE